MFNTTVETLRNCLARSGCAVAKSNVRPAMENFLLSLNGKKLDVTGSNGDLKVVESLSVNPEKGAGQQQVTVNADKFQATMRHAPPLETATVELEDAVLRVKAGNTRYSLQTIPASEYPSVDEDGQPSASFTVPQASLKRVLHNVAFAMAMGNHRYYLNGMLWAFNDGKLVAVATNGHRMALDALSVPEAKEERSAIVPRDAITELGKLLGDEEGDAKVDFFAGAGDEASSSDANRVQVTFGSTILTSQLISAKYPDHERVIPNSNKNMIVVNRNTVRNSLRRTSVIADDREYVVNGNFGEGTLTLSCKTRAGESSTDTIDLVSHEGDPMEVSLGGPYLEDVLDTLDQEEIVIALKDATSSVLIVPSEEEPTFKYVLMPVRS